MKNILVTGGGGFIGFNFLKIIIKKKYQVVNVDILNYASNKYVKKIKKKN